jgi:hypothetical protein
MRNGVRKSSNTVALHQPVITENQLAAEGNHAIQAAGYVCKPVSQHFAAE